MKILFICTNNKDRSPTIEQYYKDNYPKHEYRSAGVNKYFTGKHNTHYLTQEDLAWADLVVYCDAIHAEIVHKNFVKSWPVTWYYHTLNRGFSKENIEDYLLYVEHDLKQSIL